MAGSFLFVDGIQTDNHSKRLLRRHVMKGKNAGKTLHRTSRLKRQPSRCKTQTVAAPTDTHALRIPRQDERSPRWPSPASLAAVEFNTVGNGFALCWLPVEVTWDSLEVIYEFFVVTSYRLYSAELGLSLDEAKSLWLPTMFADEATYHCSIDLMKASNSIILCRGDGCIYALRHLSRTFDHVKKRLEGDDALSDSTIAIVMTLISQEQLRGQHVAAKIHAQGLKKIIELRGGLRSLEGNRGIVLKACKTDVVLALQHGEPTMFYRNCISDAEKTLALKGLQLNRIAVPSPRWCRSINRELYDIYVDVMAVCNLLNNNMGPGSLDVVSAQEILFSILYKLLRFRCLNEARGMFDGNSALHLGLTMLLMTIFLQHGNQKVLEFELVSECFKTVVDNATEEQESYRVLWLLLIGGIWTLNDIDSDWITRRINRVAQDIGVREWDSARAAIQNLPWIKSLHEQPGERLWNKERSISRTTGL